MKKIKYVVDKLCYGAFYARKTHPSNPPDNHDLDTLIQTEAIFIGTSAVFGASIIFTIVSLEPQCLHFATTIAITLVVAAIVIPMLLFGVNRFSKVIKEWEMKDVAIQESAKNLWHVFFWSTWIIAIILITIAALLHIIN